MKNLFFTLTLISIVIGCSTPTSSEMPVPSASMGTPESRMDSIKGRWVNAQMGKFYPVQIFQNDAFMGMGGLHQDGFCFTARHVVYATGSQGKFTAVGSNGQKFLLNRNDSFEEEIALALASNMVFDIGFLVSVDSMHHLSYPAYSQSFLQSGATNVIKPIPITSTYSGEKMQLTGCFSGSGKEAPYTLFGKRDKITLMGESGSVWLFDNDPTKVAILISDGFTNGSKEQLTMFTIVALPDGYTSW